MNVTSLIVLVWSGCRYEVNFQEGIDCGGAYVKLLTDTEDLSLVGLHVIIPLIMYLFSHVCYSTIIVFVSIVDTESTTSWVFLRCLEYVW